MVSSGSTSSGAKTGKSQVCELVVVVPPLVKVFTSRNED